MMKWVFGADTTPFRRGLDDMRTQTRAFSGSVSKMLLGAFSIGAVVGGFKMLVEQLARINDLATRFGETAETMQRIGYAAAQSGTDLEAVAKAMTVVTKNSYAAATGNKAMSEAFAKFSIDAAAFVNLPMSEKMLLLAKAMEDSKGNGEKLNDVIKILGKSGGDLLPLLGQGFDELAKQMSEASVASEASVQALAKLDDAYESVKNKAVAWGALMVDGILTAGAAVEWLLNLMNGKDVADEQFIKRMEQIAGGGATPTKPANNVDDVVAAAEAAVKAEEEGKKLAEEIAKLKEAAMMRELSLAEQINEVRRKGAEIMFGMADAGTDVEKLQKEKELLENQKELGELKKKQEQESAKAAQDIADATAQTSKRIAEAATREADAQRDRKFNGLDSEGKIKMLKEEQKELMRQSNEAGKAGDYEAQIDKRTAAAAVGDEIGGLLTESLKGVMPTIATDSLQSIGGGGSANLLTPGNEQRQIDLLQIIAENTARTETGGTNIPEPA